MNESTTDWDAVWELFHEAIALDEKKRPVFLDRACAGNTERRTRLEKLLAAYALVDESALPRLKSLFDGDDLTSFADGPEPGDLLGPYTIGERVGAGGMGTVYRAHQDEPVRRTVALKLLRFGLASRDIVARFNAERQALAMMSHSNIAKIFDAGVSPNGQPYFVMEYVSGLPITEYCDENRLDIDARLRLFLAVCDGVLHAHQKGIIHRDIKPTNVLVAEENGTPVPKIIDFGIAKATEAQLGEGTLYTRVGTLIGTPGYMSPEQAGVVQLDVDIRADVYSLGALLYELLVGMLPFEATTSAHGLLEIQEAIRDEEPQRPSHRLSGVSAEIRSQISGNRALRFPALERRLHSDIEWILLKAIDKNRERRYPSVSEFAAEICRYLDGMPVLARAPTRRYRTAKFIRRHTLGVAITAGIATLLLVVAGAMTLQSIRLQRALDETTLERNRAEQVSAFMVELFEAANPEASGRSDVSAAEILEQGAERLREELGDQPGLRARLLTTVAETYRVLGGDDNAARAIALVEEALVDLETSEAPAAQRAAAFGTMGAAYHDIGEFDNAQSYYLRALSLAEADQESALRADILGNLGVLASDRGKLPEAERYLREAIEVQKTLSGERAPLVARLKQRLAFLLHQQGKSEEAQLEIGQTLDIIREHHGPKHPSVATALNYAAIIKGKAGDPVGAQRSLTEAAEIYRETHGRDHPHVASTLSNLAMQYNRTGDFDMAVDALTEALRIGIASYGEDHPTVNSYRVNLGSSLQNMGRLWEAEPLLREGLRYDRESLQPGSPFLLATLDRLGATLDRLGQHKQAERYLREAATMRREHLGSDNAATHIAMFNLARSRLAAGAVDEAESLASESIVMQRSLADNAAARAYGLAVLGGIRYAQGRLDEARELLREALNLFGPATEKTVLLIAWADQQLAEVELESGHPDAAEDAFAAAESTLLARVPEGYPDVIEVRVARRLLACETADGGRAIEDIRAARPLLAQAIGADNTALQQIDRALLQCQLARDTN
ncbi:MAG TPA: tetratricopeptide repeat protein [Woeseiaceae bacterium]|nr:tetratricopeptide repeat protein [Woeseiaceae bacterium]